MILCYGFELLMRVMVPVQIWISTGNIIEANTFYEKYSSVPDLFLKIRKTISENLIPRRFQLFDNLELDEENLTIEIKDYPKTHEGIIQSFVDRYLIF
jgi:hypothetical protein